MLDFDSEVDILISIKNTRFWSWIFVVGCIH